MDMETRELVFLKDSWRPNVPGVKSESHWHKLLRGARNTAAFSHGSDAGKVVPRRGVRRGVKPQLTITQNYGSKYSSVEAMIGYVHYRTVQCEFDLPLETFKGSRQLTEVMYDVLLGEERLPDFVIVQRSSVLV